MSIIAKLGVVTNANVNKIVNANVAKICKGTKAKAIEAVGMKLEDALQHTNFDINEGLKSEMFNIV